jgi:hypothetical protein
VVSVSASAKVEGDTSGPIPAALLRASAAGFRASPRNAAAAPSRPKDESARNSLREFDMDPPHCIVTSAIRQSSQPQKIDNLRRSSAKTVAFIGEREISGTYGQLA